MQIFHSPDIYASRDRGGDSEISKEWAEELVEDQKRSLRRLGNAIGLSKTRLWLQQQQPATSSCAIQPDNREVHSFGHSHVYSNTHPESFSSLVSSMELKRLILKTNI